VRSRSRLDFDYFDIAEGTTGACTDSFAVSVGSSRTYTTLCGTLTGHHVYLETGRSTSAQTLTFTVASSATWKILVTQIECNAYWKAPSDCLQYYTGLSGSFKSLNYPVQIQSLQYRICFRREPGYCGIGYAPVQGSTTDTFIVETTATALNGASAYAKEAWIIIPGSIAESYSGSILAAGASHVDTSDTVIVQTGTTFGIDVLTTTTTQAANLGFHLSWIQQPCTLSAGVAEIA